MSKPNAYAIALAAIAVLGSAILAEAEWRAENGEIIGAQGERQLETKTPFIPSGVFSARSSTPALQPPVQRNEV